MADSRPKQPPGTPLPRAPERCALRLSFSVAGWTLHRACINTLWPVFFSLSLKLEDSILKGPGCSHRLHTATRFRKGRRVARPGSPLHHFTAPHACCCWTYLTSVIYLFFSSHLQAHMSCGVLVGKIASSWHKFGMWHDICDGSLVWLNNWCLQLRKGGSCVLICLFLFKNVIFGDIV